MNSHRGVDAEEGNDGGADDERAWRRASVGPRPAVPGSPPTRAGSLHKDSFKSYFLPSNALANAILSVSDALPPSLARTRAACVCLLPS